MKSLAVLLKLLQRENSEKRYCEEGLCLFYNSLSLFFICFSIEKDKCFINIKGFNIRYSFPDISNDWSAVSSSGYADFKAEERENYQLY